MCIRDRSELVAMLTMVHVKIVGEVKDIVEVVADKNVYKVKDEISRELTKEVKDMVDQDPGRDADKMIEEVAKVIFL